MRVIFEFSSKKTSFKRIKSFPFLCTDGCHVHKLKERKKSDKKGGNKILTFVFISSFIFARRTSPKTIPRRCGTILETNPPPIASPKWNYLLCRDFYGEPLLACAVSSPPSCTLAAYPCIVACSSLLSPPLSRTFVTLPVFPSSTSTPTSSTRPDIRARVYNGLAGRPKMCQVHVALLGFRAPAPLARKPPTRCRANALFPHKHARVSSLPR